MKAGAGEDALRRMLGLPLDGGTIHAPKSAVFVPALSLDDAVAPGPKQYGGGAAR